MKKLIVAAMTAGLMLSGCSVSSEEETAAVETTAANKATSSTTSTTLDDVSSSQDIKMRVEDGYIQYYNGSEWENLIAVEDLKGEKGDKGDKGDPGTNGKNGVNGTNGTNGTNGKDGADGKDGTTITANPGITRTYSIRTQNIFIYSTGKMLLGIANPGKLVINDYGNIVFQDDYGSEVDGEYKPTVGQNNGINFDMNEDGYITVTATPHDGFKFTKWSDGNTNATRTFKYTDELIISAVYEKIKSADDTNLYYPQDKEVLGYD